MNVTSRRNMKYTSRDNVSKHDKQFQVRAKTCQSLGYSKEPIIRLRVDKPANWDWELTTTAENLPVIQLLDRDGRLLVETSGKTAQRARGSFRDGLKSHEEFPRRPNDKLKDVVQVDRLPTGNRNFDGFSSKFGCQDGFRGPRKSKSDVSVDKQKRHRDATADRREDKNSQFKEVKNTRVDSLSRRKVGCDGTDEKATKSGRKESKYETLGAIQNYLDSMGTEKIAMRRVASHRTLPEMNYYRARKTRSDVNLGSSIQEETSNNKVMQKKEHGNGKRKVYRKTKSDMFLESDFESNVASPPRRIRSQDNVERSWREYRERKREERLQKNLENNELYQEEDFMAKPRWKDLQGSCSATNCKICANMQNCFDPFKASRPDTALQENYLVVQPRWDDVEGNLDETSESRDQNGQLLMSRVDQDDGEEFLQKIRGDSDYELAQNDTENNVKDYFKRVYDLLKTRRKLNPGQSTQAIPSHLAVAKGENVVAVSGPTKSRNWDERVLVRSDCCAKRPRHYYSAPVLPKSGSYCNRNYNAKDISKYFACSNKENEPHSVKLKEEQTDQTMGSNLSRHNDKGLNGRRTQSSGNLCDPKKRLNSVSRILMPCSDSSKESRYKFCGSLPNHLDGQESIDDSDLSDNNNVISDIIGGNLGGTLPYKKKSSVHFCDTSPSLDLVKHHSQDSLGGDPWLYRQDLDLVKCKHQRDSEQNVNGAETCKLCLRGKSLNEKLQRRSDLDLVGSYSKRPAHESARRNASCPEDDFRRKCSVNGTESNDDLLIKARHDHHSLPFKYPRLSTERKIDKTAAELKVKKLFGNEPQDQGYASERSPEEEHPPKLPEQALSNGSESTFTVTLQKSSRGLGLSVSGGGNSGPVRVKRLFPQQPAALSNKLKPGDILLAANGVSLTSLTNYEALEVLRTTSSTVELLVQRVAGEGNVTTPTQELPPPLPVRREAAVTRVLDPLAPLDVEPCGEFDIEMTKVAGSLGFTLRKADSSALGHYVRALVREPALSDGRIQPGDKIVAVDGALLSPMSHEEAVTLLRQCGPRVKLRLYRDMAQTPVSALSPTEPNDHPLRPPHTSLRQEAVDMLCDLAVRKLSPATSSGSSTRKSANASTSSPRKLRRPGAKTPPSESVLIKSDSGQTSSNDVEPGSYDVCDSSDSSRVHRPSFLDLSAPPGKPHFQFSVESDDYSGPMIVTDSDSTLDDVTSVVAAPISHQHQNHLLTCEPASMPPMISTVETTTFSHKNPVYQSANPATGTNIDTIKSKVTHSSDQDIPGTLDVEDPAGSQGLLKWKGVMFAPQTYRSIDENEIYRNEDTESAVTSSTINDAREQGHEVFMVELTRGWNSRLGFSLQPEGEATVISVVHPDSVAAKDGRLKQGDVLIMVNDESVEKMSTADIIDLLRKIRGSIGITVLRRKKDDDV